MTHTTNLPENRLERKRYAVRTLVGQRIGVPSKRSKKPRTVLQALFIKRVKEEMGALSGNELSRRPGGPPQTTFNDVMNGADPRLETVYQIATALNIPAWHFFIERTDLVRLRTGSPTEPPSSVTSLPGYPKMLEHGVKKGETKVRDRKTRTR
jgi:hypothetical protein